MNNKWSSINFVFDKNFVNNELLADVKFKFHGETKIIYAHSFLLSLRSESFFENFNEMIGAMKLIQVHDTPYSTFLEFMKYLYTNEVDLDQNIVFELLKLSMRYKISSLEEKCKSFLEIDVTNSIETVCQVLDSALNAKWNDIQISSLEFISNNYQAVLNSNSFLSTNYFTLNAILSLDSVSDTNEFKIFESVIKWATRACVNDKIIANGSNLRMKIDKNLQLIRFGAMTIEEFTKCDEMAEGLLTSVEMVEIYKTIAKKKPNKFGFLDRKRKDKVLEYQKQIFILSESIYVHKHIDDYITYRTSELQNTFYLDFTVSSLVLLEHVCFAIDTCSIKVGYNIWENGELVQSEQANLCERNLWLSLDLLKPAKLHPYKFYRFEYKFVDFYSSYSIAAAPFGTSSSSGNFKFIKGNAADVTIYLNNSHVNILKFKY